MNPATSVYRPESGELRPDVRFATVRGVRAGLDVKVVQRYLRHASAKTTFDTYGHMFPDKEESARAAVTEVLAARADSLRTEPSSAANSS